MTESELRALRQKLHAAPELSDQEEQTALTIRELLEAQRPDELLTGLGGHGIVATFRGAEPGPHTMIRCELDGLPIPEQLDIPHASRNAGVAHKCGHDGHMTILAGLAAWLGAQRPARGSVHLLFQPSEETGQGAARLLAAPRFSALPIDRVFALHNLPGFASGSIVWRAGTFAAASRGLWIELHGTTAHAAEPERGRSPALAMAELIQLLSAIPRQHAPLHEAAKVTVIHARLGEIAFGTTPGEAQVLATLRAHSDEQMAALSEVAESDARRVAATYELQADVRWTEEFPATVNDSASGAIVLSAARQNDLAVVSVPQPFFWSEDVGHLTKKFSGALFGLGAGEAHPPLHHPDYDFPDELLPLGVGMFRTIIQQVNG